jgi:hypothetical protein
MILAPSYVTGERMLARAYGLGETASRDVHAIIIVLADYRSAKHPSLALVATSNLYDAWIMISVLSYVTGERMIARAYGLDETPSRDVHAIITLCTRTCNLRAADPPALRYRARAVRVRPD